MSLHGNNFDISELTNILNTNSSNLNSPSIPVPGASNDGFDLFSADGLFKSLSGLSDFAGAFASLKGLGLAKDQFNFQKDAFGVNLSNQANLTNSQLSDRQRRRNLENPNSIPLADYLAQFGVSGSIDGSNPVAQSGQAGGISQGNATPLPGPGGNTLATALAGFNQIQDRPRQLPVNSTGR